MDCFIPLLWRRRYNFIVSILLLTATLQPTFAWNWNWNRNNADKSDKDCKTDECRTTDATSEKNGTEENNSTNTAEVYYTAADSASWAITSNKLSSVLGHDKQVLYDNYVSNCNDAFLEEKPELKTKSPNVCGDNENYRLRMNREQPSSVYNYTKEGYKKMKAPTDLFELIKEFWNNNRHLNETEWNTITVYHNTWDSPTSIVHLAQEHTGGSTNLQSLIWEKTKGILEEWTGHYLNPVSLWGIRLYHNGSILAPHVDRMPLITSAIIQVDQDIDEPWPLEVYGHNGKAVNVTMEPGDMVLYESHSVIHGRPFPLRGSFYANCFVHFEINTPIEGESTYNPELDIPPYLIHGSSWENDWKEKNPNGWKKTVAEKENVRVLATKGDIVGMQKMIHDFPEKIHEEDDLGWTVLHECVRSGKLQIIKLLLKHGVDKDLITKTGVSPLNIAKQYLGENHEVSKYLQSVRAMDISPGYRNPKEIVEGEL